MYKVRKDKCEFFKEDKIVKGKNKKRGRRGINGIP